MLPRTKAERLLTPSETASRFGVSLSTLERMIKEDARLEKVKVSTRCVRFRESNVEAVIESLTQVE